MKIRESKGFLDQHCGVQAQCKICSSSMLDLFNLCVNATPCTNLRRFMVIPYIELTTSIGCQIFFFKKAIQFENFNLFLIWIELKTIILLPCRFISRIFWEFIHFLPFLHQNQKFFVLIVEIVQFRIIIHSISENELNIRSIWWHWCSSFIQGR